MHRNQPHKHDSLKPGSIIFRGGLNFLFYININLPVTLQYTGYSLAGWQDLYSREKNNSVEELKTVLKVLFTADEIVKFVIQE